MIERTSLIAVREKLGLTRPQLAETLGLSRSYVYRVEIGDCHPGLTTILDWLAALGPSASIDMFLPHPNSGVWSRLLAEKVRLPVQALVA
jgi:transcriptional regulator with XRE-family HTH domain